MSSKSIKSLKIKLIGSFVIFSLIITIFTYFFLLVPAQKAIKGQMQMHVMEAAGMVSAQINGIEAEEMVALTPEDEGTEKYKVLARHLNLLRSNSDNIRYIYPIKKLNGTLVWTVDDELFDNPSDPLFSHINEMVEDTDPAMFEGFERIVSTDEFYTDDWGTFLSGYAPLKDRQGNIIGTVGVDIEAKEVIKSQNFINVSTYIIFIFLILFMLVFIEYLTSAIIRRINYLNKVSKEFIYGNHKVSIDLKSGDEIGELAETLRDLSGAIVKKEFELKEKIVQLEEINSLTSDSEIYAEQMRSEKEELVKILKEELFSIKKELSNLKKEKEKEKNAKK